MTAPVLHELVDVAALLAVLVCVHGLPAADLWKCHAPGPLPRVRRLPLQALETSCKPVPENNPMQARE